MWSCTFHAVVFYSKNTRTKRKCYLLISNWIFRIFQLLSPPAAPRYLANEETHKLMKFSDIPCILLTSLGLRNWMIENTGTREGALNESSRTVIDRNLRCLDINLKINRELKASGRLSFGISVDIFFANADIDNTS